MPPPDHACNEGAEKRYLPFLLHLPPESWCKPRLRTIPTVYPCSMRLQLTIIELSTTLRENTLMAITETDGFLLTRQWRDTPQGLELVFWLSTANGPLRLQVNHEKAVCFIKRSNRLNLPAGIRRTQVQLNTLDNTPVDALYFPHQRDLKQLREHLAYDKQQLFESELKPTDRFLMERQTMSNCR